MFAKLVVSLVCAFGLVASVVASPVAYKPSTTNLTLSERGSSHSFNNWGGFTSLNNFDNFYGVDNFDGSRFSQVVVREQEVVCRTQRIEIIQQQLVILQEMAKRIISEQICEVETQTIVFEQWHSSLYGFNLDLRRHSGHQVGYDRNIVSHFGEIINVDGSFNYHDFGFSGHDVGRQTVVVRGSNWDDRHSRPSVESAYQASRSAYHSLH